MESGTKLAHYEILSPLGKGGMGEVWRARDTKLGRDVAIKSLPEEFAKDADRLARFEREARLLASLNHPNIAAIHGFEEDNGIHFLVLELVEGETLADQLKRGAIPAEESLRLALQIAEALEAAHEKGVIHRDLKPANVKVTPDGKVKVLDFGLAKAFAGDEADVSVSNSPTLSMAATGQGIILGTAAYMSPEQAGGEAIDKRADVWSFGVVLFEMLSGRRVFTGKNVSRILASVLNSEPEWTSLPANIHPRVRMLLERSLEKETKDRLAGISDARVDIEKVLADAAGVLVQPTAEVVETPRQSLPWVAAVLIVAVLAGIGGWVLNPSSGELHSIVRFPFVLPADQQFTNTNWPLVDISTDGTQLAYAADGRIHLRDLNEVEVLEVQGSEDALPLNPVFSPGGLWLAYSSGGAGVYSLKRIPIGGGTPVPVWEGSSRPVDLQWETDDTILFVQPEGVVRVPAGGGNAEVIVEAGELESLGTPRLLPEGDQVLFTATTFSTDLLSWDAAQILVQRIDSDERTLVWEGGSDARYISTGHLVYAQGNTLFALPFDLDSLEVTGGATPIVEGIRRSDNSSVGTGQYAFSDDGTLISVPGSGPAGVRNSVLAWIDRNGVRESLPVPSRPYQSPRLSPDGTRLAVQTTDANGESDIWVYNLDGNTQMREMTGGGNNMRPIWTPDGERLTFTSNRDGSERIYSQPSDLSGVAEPLTTADEDAVGSVWAESWTRDGSTLSLTRLSGGGGAATLSLDDGTVTGVPGGGGNTAFSPDGTWLVYRNNRGGSEELYMRPFPLLDGTELQLTQEGGSAPMWSPDGRELFYRRGVQALAVRG